MKSMSLLKQILFVSVIICFAGTILVVDLLQIKETQASVLGLPEPGQLLRAANDFSLPVLKGIKLDPVNPLKIDFIVDNASSSVVSSDDAKRIVSYFLAGLTIPTDDLWVNLSPYEKDRIIPNELGITDMGKDMLAQDYILKQLSSSLTHPDTPLGKDYWSMENRNSEFEIRNDFNKIWIAPDSARISEFETNAVIIESTLKVLTETDYLAEQHNNTVGANPRVSPSDDSKSELISELKRIVNNGKDFAQLRQIYNSLILAKWFKAKFASSFYKHYFDTKKVQGIDIEDRDQKTKIFNLYCDAFRKGTYDFLKSEKNIVLNKRIKRRYFSGGVEMFAAPKVDVAASAISLENQLKDSAKSISKFSVDLLSSAVIANPMLNMLFELTMTDVYSMGSLDAITEFIERNEIDSETFLSKFLIPYVNNSYYDLTLEQLNVLKNLRNWFAVQYSDQIENKYVKEIVLRIRKQIEAIEFSVSIPFEKGDLFNYGDRKFAVGEVYQKNNLGITKSFSYVRDINTSKEYFMRWLNRSQAGEYYEVLSEIKELGVENFEELELIFPVEIEDGNLGYCLLTEIIDGDMISQYIDQIKGQRVLSYLFNYTQEVLAIAKSLKKMNDNLGYEHRDIHSGNIIVDKNGGFNLVDFEMVNKDTLLSDVEGLGSILAMGLSQKIIHKRNSSRSGSAANFKWFLFDQGNGNKTEFNSDPSTWTSDLYGIPHLDYLCWLIKDAMSASIGLDDFIASLEAYLIQYEKVLMMNDYDLSLQDSAINQLSGLDKQEGLYGHSADYSHILEDKKYAIERIERAFVGLRSFDHGSSNEFDILSDLTAISGFLEISIDNIDKNSSVYKTLKELFKRINVEDLIRELNVDAQILLADHELVHDHYDHIVEEMSFWVASGDEVAEQIEELLGSDAMEDDMMTKKLLTKILSNLDRFTSRLAERIDFIEEESQFEKINIVDVVNKLNSVRGGLKHPKLDIVDHTKKDLGLFIDANLRTLKNGLSALFDNAADFAREHEALATVELSNDDKNVYLRINNKDDVMPGKFLAYDVIMHRQSVFDLLSTNRGKNKSLFTLFDEMLSDPDDVEMMEIAYLIEEARELPVKQKLIELWDHTPNVDFRERLRGIISKMGTGVGTTEAYYAVKDCGGDIRVESNEEEGTTFIVTIPLVSSSSLEINKGGIDLDLDIEVEALSSSIELAPVLLDLSEFTGFSFNISEILSIGENDSVFV